MSEFNLDHRFSTFGLSNRQLNLMVTFLEKIWSANRELNLVSRKMEAEDLVDLHLLDSLLALPYVPKAKKITDLGTGSGFPAIPLAIAFPEVEFTLVEKSPRKCEFLKSLNSFVPNIIPLCEQVPGGVYADTDLIICRAFKPLPVILELTADYCRDGGSYLLWKGRLETIDGEIKASKRWLKKTVEIKKISLSHPSRDVERHLVYINPKK